MGKVGEQRQTFSFTSPLSPANFKLDLREAVRSTGDLLYEDTPEGFDLGIERGGHSGGYWYRATLTETEAGSEMRGEIVYRSLHGDGNRREETKWEKIRGRLFIAVTCLLCVGPILIAYAIRGAMVLIGKLRKKPVKSAMTTEEKLTHFMTEIMGCATGKEVTPTAL